MRQQTTPTDMKRHERTPDDMIFVKMPLDGFLEFTKCSLRWRIGLEPSAVALIMRAIREHRVHFPGRHLVKTVMRPCINNRGFAATTDTATSKQTDTLEDHLIAATFGCSHARSKLRRA